MTSTVVERRRRQRASHALRRLALPGGIGAVIVLLAQFALWPIFNIGLPTLQLLGAFGDFLSGYLGTLIALVSVLLLYYNLREQRRAIREQRRSFEHQQRANDHQRAAAERALEEQRRSLEEQRRASDLQREAAERALAEQRSSLDEQRQANQLHRAAAERASFENKYFALIQMHRDNVAEMRLHNALGRRVFVDMMRELRAILQVVRHVAKRERYPLTQRQLCNVGFYCLFYGVGPNAGRQLRKAFTGYPPAFFERLNRLLSRSMVWKLAKDHERFTHRPFDGHQSRLGHYYRHLYQTFRFIHEQPFTRDEKYEYAKTVRAQLSTHEQALLFLNSISPQGQGWWDRDFMKEYRLVQNIPENFFDKDLEIDLKDAEFFGGVRYFEWEGR